MYIFIKWEHCQRERIEQERQKNSNSNRSDLIHMLLAYFISFSVQSFHRWINRWASERIDFDWLNNEHCIAFEVWMIFYLASFQSHFICLLSCEKCSLMHRACVLMCARCNAESFRKWCRDKNTGQKSNHFTKMQLNCCEWEKSD